MTQYIDKSEVVAEIERRLRELSQLKKLSYEIGLYDAYKIVLSFLDTLEVKEEPVSEDLEESANNYVGHAPEIDEDLSCFTKRNAFIAGAQWQKEQMIGKACKWWENELIYPTMTHEEIDYYQSKIIVFRKTMEE